MDKQAFATFFAILTVLVQLFVVGTVAGAVVLRTRPQGALAARVARARDVVATDALWLATIVATVTMLGSLYLSEIADYPPCKLCWLQRIAMYPLSVICFVAACTGDRRVHRYVVPLATIGAAISVYHYQLERFPEQHSLTCSRDVPCTTVWIWRFHYVSIPLMALSAFATVAVLVLLARRGGPADEAWFEDDEPDLDERAWFTPASTDPDPRHEGGRA